MGDIGKHREILKKESQHVDWIHLAVFADLWWGTVKGREFLVCLNDC
jgi:hypothetical protein